MKTFSTAALVMISALPAHAHVDAGFHVHEAETGILMLVAAIVIGAGVLWKMR